ncbi:MAG: HAD family hydrolase [Acidobacteria bacterium]|nr:HAD family hydrolase [Acidobacteriota bacterium]
MRLILFDIDGTLLLTGGAGSKALARALHEIYGLANGMEAIKPDGKTDPMIVREALERHGNRAGENDFERLFSRYLSYLEEELQQSRSFKVLPGVAECLAQLHQQPDLLLGLATGNLEVGARLKLRQAGLDTYFSYGGYASDSENRTELIRIAIERGAAKAAPRSHQVAFVVGDTPRDIIHGREAGARTIAVATGSYNIAQLTECHPDLVIENLTEQDPLLEFLLS